MSSNFITRRKKSKKYNRATTSSAVRKGSSAISLAVGLVHLKHFSFNPYIFF